MIAGNAGILVTKVLYVKRGEGRTFVIVDAAMNDLIRPTLYDAFHALRPVTEPAAEAPRLVADVVGPVCESGDYLAKGREMPEPAPGDLIAVMSAGAYGAVQAGTYNTRPLVPEVLVRGAEAAVVRPRQEGRGAHRPRPDAGLALLRPGRADCALSPPAKAAKATATPMDATGRVLPLSVFIIARNEADRIGATIRAIRDLTDDLVVVDSGSTDGTQALAESLGARVIHNPWPGYGPQKAVRRGAVPPPLAPEPRCGRGGAPGLAAEIRALFAAGEPSCPAWRIGIAEVFRRGPAIPSPTPCRRCASTARTGVAIPPPLFTTGSISNRGDAGPSAGADRAFSVARSATSWTSSTAIRISRRMISTPVVS